MVFPAQVIHRLLAGFVEHRTGDRAGVNSAPFFVAWHALNAMASRLIVEARDALFERDHHHRLGCGDPIFSMTVIEITSVCFCQVLHEQLGVIAALCGAKFNDLHCRPFYEPEWLRPYLPSTGECVHYLQQELRPLLDAELWRKISRLLFWSGRVAG